jgi:hypothetical protein
MKAKVTSNDQIDEITMTEDEVTIRVPQGKITIKADDVSTKIQYYARNAGLNSIDTAMVLDRFDNHGVRQFTLYLISK